MANLPAIRPDPDDKRLAREIHAHFAAKPGSDHIASLFALAHLAALLRVRPIRSVLEFGSGIGTITALLLRGLPADARIVCAERDAWCREQFMVNLPASQRARVQLIPEGKPAVTESFDLVVVDGPVTPGSAFLQVDTICFAEGDRHKACRGIVEALAERGLDCTFKQHSPRWPQSLWRRKGCSIGIVQPIAAARAGNSADEAGREPAAALRDAGG